MVHLLIKKEERVVKKVLIVSTNKSWSGISRLPSALTRSGFATYVLCPKKSFISYTKYLADSITYPTWTYSRSKIFYFFILYSLIKFRPEKVIPGDEEALLALQNLSNFFERLPFLSEQILIIRNSIGPKDTDELLLSKSVFVECCKEWGVKVPSNQKVKSLSEALEAGRKMNFPLVIKLDEGYGGSGVFICHTEEELINNFSKISQFSFFKKLKAFFQRNFFITLKNEMNISIQQYVKGITGATPFFASKGKMLASNSMLKIQTYPDKTGPSSVVQGLNSEEMKKNASLIAKKINYNGFGSLDFIQEEGTNDIYIIELNPRPVPLTHFSDELVAYDLCKTFFRSCNDLDLDQKEFKNFTIALFPNEKKRDLKSPYLKSAYHDVPHDDPKLFEALNS